ncbi:MAG: hypothetical protein M3Q29_10620 [Chloroflexota bacterium]|nr:hypothetical protein [Chloroflexota bacterium]
MATAVPQVRERFEALDRKTSVEDYNYKHFRTKHYLADARANILVIGVQPGEVAPDFYLPRTDGGYQGLTELRGKPVLLRFGSPT